MAATYNVNGQQMSAEEFQKWQQENGFAFEDFGNFSNYQSSKKRWDHKMHIFQCYKDTVPDRWLEITEQELKDDIKKVPLYKKKLFYVQKSNKEYVIIESPVVAVFYNHFEDCFLYMKEGGIIKESNCFKTYDDAFNAIKKIEEKKYGLHTLFDVNGNVIKTYN